MKWFVLLRESDITSEMLSNTGNSESKPEEIFTEGDSPVSTGYWIISIREKHSTPFAGYIKYTQEQFLKILKEVRAGKKISTRFVRPSKQSAFLDPEGARARFQSLGMFTANCNDEVVWTSDQDYYITGVVFFVQGSEIGDTVNFEVHHPQAGLLDSFAVNWFIWDGKHSYEVYPARILKGLQIKVVLKKAAGNTLPTTLIVNGKLHGIT